MASSLAPSRDEGGTPSHASEAAHGIVAEHGGRLDVESEPGKGPRVTISLPCCEAPEATPPAPKAKEREEGRGEVVIVVEDDRHVRSIMTSALSSAKTPPRN